MNNLKEENIRRAIWHIKRHLDGLLNSKDEVDRKYCSFHLQSSIECLERVMNNKKPYLYLICTLFTGHPVRRVFSCVTVMSIS